MSLTKQVHLYSIGTDAFYNEDEQYIHKRLLRLYGAKKRNKLGWKKTAYNKLIAKEKKSLIEKLNERLLDTTPRQLNPEVIKDKNVISLFESSLTRALGLKTNELTLSILVLNVFFFQIFESLVKYGFDYNNEHYIFLSASAGQIRTKRAIFIKQQEYDRIANRLMCGLTIDDINEAGGINSNKFNAYLSLNNSATDVWEDFDIDRSIVVPDFETNVGGEVDFIDDFTYDIQRKYMEIPIPHTDGCGMMLDGPTRMVRLPWVKGLLITFPYDKFIKEYCQNGEAVIKDIYGKSHDILAEGIRYIFTESQFKLYKFYHSWDEYKFKFKKFGCEACYCNIEESYIPKARINYQMLQTLSDITDAEIDRIIEPTVDEINLIGKDFQTSMRLLGATEYNTNKSWFQESLIYYPELLKDAYSREILKQTKKSLIKQAKAGRLRVNGRYTFVSPDLFAFCQWLFLGDNNPSGLLEEHQVYCNLYKDTDELACLRSPHLYREWAIKYNVRSEELDKWFGQTKAIFTSVKSTISRILQFDCDGDKLLVIKNQTLTTVAKRNMKGIVPLYYEMRKAKGGELTPENIYQGMAKAFTSGNIGPYSNNITKIWNCGEKIAEEQLNVVKWLCMENNFVIDYAKTLYQPTRPKSVGELIKTYTKAKVPYFFQYAKDKDMAQVEPSNGSAMNRLSNRFYSSRMIYLKNMKGIDFRFMLSDMDFKPTEKSYKVLELYDYWNKHQKFLYNTADENHVNQEDLWVYQQIRKNVAEAFDWDIDFVTNSLVSIYYTARNLSQKKMLWGCFGDKILENLKTNTKLLGDICPVCGKRFVKNGRQLTCSKECGHKLDMINKRLKRSGDILIGGSVN